MGALKTYIVTRTESVVVRTDASLEEACRYGLAAMAGTPAEQPLVTRDGKERPARMGEAGYIAVSDARTVSGEARLAGPGEW